MFSKHQDAQTADAFNAERTRLVRNDLATAVAQAHAQLADLDDRLKASVVAENEATPASTSRRRASLS
jgi:hypothetical protein